MKTHDIDAAVRGLDPLRSTDQVSDDAWTDMADAVTAQIDAPVVALAPRRSPRRLVLAAACTLLIGGVVAGAFVNRPHQDQPEALSFTQHGNTLIVRVVDPTADPERYNAEFKKMGLNVTVHAVPVSPPGVGGIISFSGRDEHDMSQLRIVKAGELCNGTLNASDPGCQEGVELPRNYKGVTEIEFGRAAKKDEVYRHTSSSATEKGEVLAGLTVKNKTVAQIRPLLEGRGIRLVEYVTDGAADSKPKDSAPDNWYVHDAVTYAEGEISLYVGPKPAS
ncbi:hypothetical protein ACWGID_00145 [Kribbella sp. NPDC054772]